jgi:AraC-like DNA-binding protein
MVVSSNTSGFTMQIPHIFRTALPVGLLIGPASFLYIQSIRYRSSKLTSVQWLHFLPALLVFLDFLPFYLSGTADKQSIYTAYLINPSQVITSVNESLLFNNWIYWVNITSCIIYSLLQGRLIYRTIRKQHTWRDTSVSTSQVKWFAALTVFLFVAGMMLIWAKLAQPGNLDVFVVFALVYTFAFTMLSLVLYRSPELLYPIPISTAPAAAIEFSEASKPEKKEYIPLSSQQIEDYCQQVRVFLRDQKCFLDPELSLSQLAQEIDISRNHLSIVLNRGMGMRFNDLINCHRLLYLQEHFKEMNYQHLTVEGIASEVGFKSRTTFMHTVKKFTDLTPTQFLQALKQNDPLVIKLPK